MLATTAETNKLTVSIKATDIQLPQLSKASGVSVTMLKRIASGKEKSLRYDVYRRVMNALERHQKE